MSGIVCGARNIFPVAVRKKHKPFRRFVRLVLFWLGMLLIALLAIPTGVLLVFICSVWTAVDRILSLTD